MGEETVIKNPFVVEIPNQFSTLKEMLSFSLSDEAYLDGRKLPDINEFPEGIKEFVQGGGPVLNTVLDKPKRRDTSVGGNDVINPYPQFCENDDIIHPNTALDNTMENGLGRVYNEVFDKNQQILYLSAGTPDFTNLTKFWTECINTELADLMNNGDISIIKKVGRVLGSVIGVVAAAPLYPIKWIFDITHKLSNVSVSKYYDFKGTMPLYYRIVNTILAHLAVNMKLIEMEDLNTYEQEYSSLTGDKEEGSSEYETAMPDILKKMDIVTMLKKRDIYDEIVRPEKVKNLDDLIQELNHDELSVWEKFIGGFKGAIYESLTYIGFRVDKSLDSSESISNTTKQSSIASTVNSKIEEQRNLIFKTANFQFTDNIIFESLEGLAHGLMNVAEGAAKTFNISGGLEILKGSGFIDIPETWSNSSFSKSYNFKMKFVPLYGNNLCIWQKYIPLACLIAMAFPRAVGKNAYTGPFILRGYCKGMVAFVTGIIDSMSIKRGGPDYGWNADSLPLSLDVSFSIKDLSPLMYVALSDSKNWFDVFGQNSSYQEYLLTLSGVGIKERTLAFDRLKKRVKTVLKISMSNRFNPTLIGYSLGHTRLGNVICNLCPVSRLPD